jgi:O-antigen/teichoic acid export membrane protein
VIGVFFFGPVLFKWYLGDQWEMAGYYARSITPLLFFYFIISPISGLPILMNQQKNAFLLSVFGYALSVFSLYMATWYGYNFGQALWFYSGAFCIYNILLLYWYYTMIKKQNAGIN